MDAYGDVIYNAYGSSEVGIGALATPADLREAPETVGRPVVDNAVIGVPDEDYGQRLAAFVVPKGGAAIKVESVREYLNGRVSRFEQPRDITIVESIPRNPAGKVLRNELDVSS